MTGKGSAPRVLLVSPLQVVPTQSGGNLRTFSLANALVSHGCEVFVYSFLGRKAEYLARRGSEVQVWDSGIEEFVDRSFLRFVAGYGSYYFNLPPLWLTKFLRAATSRVTPLRLPKLLREKLAWSDVVLADFPFAYPVLNAREASGRLRVLNLHNVEHHLFETSAGLKSRMIRRGVQKAELSAAATADVVVSCSEADQRYFDDNAEVKRSMLVPNGIDLGRFQRSAEVRAATRKELQVAEDVQLLLFTASKWGPNSEAFDYLLDFAKQHGEQLVERRIQLLVVGSVVSEPVRVPGLIATGRVEAVEPYFAAADAAINPITTGAGTNVKMGEFIAAGLPILVSEFGSRGYRIEHGESGFVFDREKLLSSLVEMRRRFDEDPDSLRRAAQLALKDNRAAIDMSECVRPLLAAMQEHIASGP
ncbi:MAG: glycosyltransferase family 4 protein, partial [Planctomycetota bacterium]